MDAAFARGRAYFLGGLEISIPVVPLLIRVRNSLEGLGWFGTDFKTFLGFFWDFYSPFWGQERFENDREP